MAITFRGGGAAGAGDVVELAAGIDGTNGAAVVAATASGAANDDGVNAGASVRRAPLGTKLDESGFIMRDGISRCCGDDDATPG